MQDGAPCHTGRSVKAYLQQKNVPALGLPVNLPDINLIENVFELMKRELAKATKSI